jgi:DNA mismatch endonuclease (patch repair protein)
MMAGIGGRNTRPELRLRKALHARGFRYRLHARELPGRPDLVFPRYRAVVFVHGCFWHRHTACRLTTTPAANASFWQEKFDSNVARDARNIAALRSLSWRVAVVWECALRERSIDNLISDLTEWLRGETGIAEFPAQVAGPS